MIRAILTIDDVPTRITPQLVDYLLGKGITPVINFIGAAVPDHFEEAVYAVKKGIVIGNHSYMHDHFSEQTLEVSREEIQRTEQEINKVYEAAGVKREYRIFRFPYGDNGGEHEAALQKMLKEEFHFDRLDDSAVTFPLWKENYLDQLVNMHWSFDFLEYELAWNNGFTFDSILKRIHDLHPVQGCPLLTEEGTNIVLMHDSEATEKALPKYYEKIIDYVLSLGVEFLKPSFVHLF